MLTTDKREAELQNANLRYQKHGDERVPAVDLKLQFNIGSIDLDGIVPGMRETLYRQPKQGDQMELDAGPEGWTALRHPDIEPVKVKGKFPGYELGLSIANDEEATEGFVDVELKKLTFDPMEGGTVVVTVTASLTIEEDDAPAVIAFLRAGDVLLTLTPPAQAVAGADTQTAEPVVVTPDPNQQALH